MHLFYSCIMSQVNKQPRPPCGDWVVCKFCQVRPPQLNLGKGYCVECENAGVPGEASHLPKCAICEHRHTPAPETLASGGISNELVEE